MTARRYVAAALMFLPWLAGLAVIASVWAVCGLAGMMTGHEQELRGSRFDRMLDWWILTPRKLLGR